MQVAGDSREVIARRWRQGLCERASVRVRFTRAEMRRADAAAGKWMMSLATKMNMKPGTTVRLVAVPSGLVPEFGSRISVTTDDARSDALVVFVTNEAALENHEAVVVESASADRLTWVA